jgi:hypothetical protein
MTQVALNLLRSNALEHQNALCPSLRISTSDLAHMFISFISFKTNTGVLQALPHACCFSPLLASTAVAPCGNLLIICDVGGADRLEVLHMSPTTHMATHSPKLTGHNTKLAA